MGKPAVKAATHSRVMADTSQDESSLADSIIQKVAQEQAYQDLQDRLKAAEEECLKERQEKEKLKAEKDELGEHSRVLTKSSTRLTISFDNSDIERATPRSQLKYPSDIRQHLLKCPRLRNSYTGMLLWLFVEKTRSQIINECSYSNGRRRSCARTSHN